MTKQRSITCSRRNMEAWEYDTDTWNIATNDNGCIEVVGSAKLTTTRERKDDWSGRRSFRVIIKTEAVVSIRVGHGADVTLSGPLVFYTGPVQALRKLFEFFRGGHSMSACRFDLGVQALRAGLPMITILDAEYSNRGDNDDKSVCRRLYYAIQEHTQTGK